MVDLKILPAIGVAFAVASCTPSARLELGHSGAAPHPATIGVSTDSTVPPQFESAVIDGLKAQGFTLSDRPSYRLQLSVSHMRGKAGLFAPDEQQSAINSWIMHPARSRSVTTVRATMRLTDAMTGRELFRAHANERSKKDMLEIGKRLADALVNQLQKPSPDHGAERSEEAE